MWGNLGSQPAFEVSNVSNFRSTEFQSEIATRIPRQPLISELPFPQHCLETKYRKQCWVLFDFVDFGGVATRRSTAGQPLSQTQRTPFRPRGSRLSLQFMDLIQKTLSEKPLTVPLPRSVNLANRTREASRPISDKTCCAILHYR